MNTIQIIIISVISWVVFAIVTSYLLGLTNKFLGIKYERVDSWIILAFLPFAILAVIVRTLHIFYLAINEIMDYCYDVGEKQ